MFSTRLRTLLVPSTLVLLALGSALLIAQTKKASGKTVKNEVQTFKLAPGSRVIIENEAGDISVESWDKPACEVNIFKASSEPENFEKIKVDVEEGPSRLRIKTAYRERLAGDNSVNYVISVPSSVDLQIRTGVGRIQVRDVTGRLSLQAERGDLHLKNIEGSVDGKTEAGNIVLDLERPITRDISLRTDEGGAQLNIAKDLNAFVWAESEEGKILNTIKFQELFTQESGSLKGRLGNGGKLVRLQVGRGEIKLTPTTAQASAPAPDATSAPPADAATARPDNKAATKGTPETAVDSASEAPSTGAGRQVKAPVDTDLISGPAVPATPGKPLSAEPLASPSASATPPPTAAEPPPHFRSKSQPADTPTSGTRVAGGKVTIKVDTNLISLNATVRDRSTGKSLIGLKQSDFDLFEDNIRQEVAYFRPVETPFHLLLLLDISGSIEEKFDVVQEASIRFTQLLKPQDRIAIATFNHEFTLVKDFTNDRKELARSILEIMPGGGTAFYDAMDYSINSVFKGVSGRKAIVVFTDGVDNQHMPELRQYGSALLFPELYRQIEESDITIYSIFLNTEGDPRSGVVLGGNSVWDNFDSSSIVGDVLGIKKRRSNSSAPKKKNTAAGPVYSDMYANAIDELNKMADQTGGKMFSPTDARDLNGIYEQIVDDLSTQYSLGYYPSNPSIDGAWRKISVKVKGRSDTVVKSRKGYYARVGSDAQRKGRTLDLGRTRDPNAPDKTTARPKRRVF